MVSLTRVELGHRDGPGPRRPQRRRRPGPAALPVEACDSDASASDTEHPSHRARVIIRVMMPVTRADPADSDSSEDQSWHGRWLWPRHEPASAAAFGPVRRQPLSPWQCSETLELPGPSEPGPASLSHRRRAQSLSTRLVVTCLVTLPGTQQPGQDRWRRGRRRRRRLRLRVTGSQRLTRGAAPAGGPSAPARGRLPHRAAEPCSLRLGLGNSVTAPSQGGQEPPRAPPAADRVVTDSECRQAA